MGADPVDIVQKLARDFLNRSLIVWPQDSEDWKLFTWKQQQYFLDATVYNPLLTKYPVNSDFTKLFFKKIISCLDGNGLDVHDGMYGSLCLAMESKTDNEFCYRHYMINQNLDDIIVIKETKNMVVNGTTGMRTWEAALMLADWALCNKQVFKNKNVIELGAGVGFTGITIAKHCSTKSILLTDCHTDVLNTINQNIRINFPKSDYNSPGRVNINDGMINVEALLLDWNNIEEVPCETNPDLLIGADIVYDPSIFLPLCKVIQYFIDKNKNLEVYIASVVRNEDTLQGFNSLLGTMGFEVDELEHSPVYISWDKSTKRCFSRIRSNEFQEDKLALS